MSLPTNSQAIDYLLEARSLFDLHDKVALVTGASRGIGLAMTACLASAGADIIGVSSTLDEIGSEAQHVTERFGRTFSGFRVDLSDRTSVLHFVQTLKDLDPPVDILVNNAGVIERAPAVGHGLDLWDRVVEVDLTAPFILTQAVASTMLERGAGKIIFVGSLLSFQGGINVPGYTAAKSALLGLTKALSNEWAASGVNVNAIVPGYIATDNTKALREDSERFGEITRRIPAGRWGVPDDLAGATLLLASAASNYVHGTAIAVDGGWLGR